MKHPRQTPKPSAAKHLPLVLLLATLAVVFGTGCESMRCYTCPDARNQAASEFHG